MCKFDYINVQILGNEILENLDIFNKKQLPGNKYEISADIMDGETADFLGSLSATVAVKEADGKRFWSFYKVEKEYRKVYGEDNSDGAQANDQAENNAEENVTQPNASNQSSSETIYVYEGTQIPDFGYYYDHSPNGDITDGTVIYDYAYGKDLDYSEQISLDKYFDLLKKLGYTQQTSDIVYYEYMFTSKYGKVYINSEYISEGCSLFIYSPDQF